MQLLLAAQAAIDQPNHSGTAPLHTACFKGHGDCVQLLLAAHAATDQLKDNGGINPLHTVCSAGSLDLVISSSSCEQVRAPTFFLLTAAPPFAWLRIRATLPL